MPACPPRGLRRRKYMNVALLAIDEVGFEQLGRAEASLLFRLVSYRYGRGSILITTNKGIKDWPEMLAGDEILATAILDRLLHKSHVLNIKGRSYRLRDLEARRRQPRLSDASRRASAGPPASGTPNSTLRGIRTARPGHSRAGSSSLLRARPRTRGSRRARSALPGGFLGSAMLLRGAEEEGGLRPPGPPRSSARRVDAKP